MITRQAAWLIAEKICEGQNLPPPVEIGDLDIAMAAFIAAIKLSIAEELGFFPNSFANANVVEDAANAIFHIRAQEQCVEVLGENSIVTLVRELLLDAARCGNCKHPMYRNAAASLAVALRHH